MRKAGVHVEIGLRVSGVERTSNGFQVRAGDTSYAADLVVHAAGRVPDVADMGLEAGHVASSSKGIRVNAELRSESNPRVYAAGDCADTGNPALTPVAGYEGAIAAANILRTGSRELTPHVIPSVVFTVPPLARVGMLESDAKKAGVDYKCSLQDTSGWYSSRRVGEEAGASKVLTDAKSGRVLGAHVFGQQAEELINVFALAIRCGLTVEDLKDQIFAYPTHGSDVQYMV